jgi:hypothetical protein
MYSPHIYAALAEARRSELVARAARPRPERSAPAPRARRRLPRVSAGLHALRARV